MRYTKARALSSRDRRRATSCSAPERWRCSAVFCWPHDGRSRNPQRLQPCHVSLYGRRHLRDDRSRPLRSTYCKLRYRRGAAPLQTLTGARQHLLKARARRIAPRYSTKSSREPFETPTLRKAKAHAETAFESSRDLYTFAHLNSVSSLAGSRLMTNE